MTWKLRVIFLFGGVELGRWSIQDCYRTPRTRSLLSTMFRISYTNVRLNHGRRALDPSLNTRSVPVLPLPGSSPSFCVRVFPFEAGDQYRMLVPMPLAWFGLSFFAFMFSTYSLFGLPTFPWALTLSMPSPLIAGSVAIASLALRAFGHKVVGASETDQVETNGPRDLVNDRESLLSRVYVSLLHS